MKTARKDADERPAVVTAADNLVFESAESTDHLHELIGAGRRRIVYDLRNATYVSGAGLGVVADAVKQARRRGGDIKLVVRRPEVRRVFELGELDALFEFYEDVESARNAFADCVGEVERTLLWKSLADD
ncbi:MAG: STAS domain-containing protein [Verrucomicrobia bacterium]|nr:STAS domain-containing protein [Verrucomicrobiota bacterium]